MIKIASPEQGTMCVDFTAVRAKIAHVRKMHVAGFLKSPIIKGF
jgi:hypothetical protein